MCPQLLFARLLPTPRPAVLQKAVMWLRKSALLAVEKLLHRRDPYGDPTLQFVLPLCMHVGYGVFVWRHQPFVRTFREVGGRSIDAFNQLELFSTAGLVLAHVSGGVSDGSYLWRTSSVLSSSSCTQRT